MKINNLEIKVCPFFGSDRVFLCERKDVYKMICLNCFATGPEYRNMSGCIRKWNKAIRKEDK